MMITYSMNVLLCHFIGTSLLFHCHTKLMKFSCHVFLIKVILCTFKHHQHSYESLKALLANMYVCNVTFLPILNLNGLLLRIKL